MMRSKLKFNLLVTTAIFFAIMGFYIFDRGNHSQNGQVFNSPEYGVFVFMWWDPIKSTARNLPMVQEIGFTWVKQTFSWRDIEAIQKGRYDWWRPDQIVREVSDSGLNLLVRIDGQPWWTQENPTVPIHNGPPTKYEDFGDFCGALAKRYKGQIPAYQIWNEPNLSRDWGNQPPNPVEYTELLKVCYLAIKRYDANAIVISAGLAPTNAPLPQAMPDMEFLQGMYDAGAGAYFDVLGVHAPGFKAPPELSPDEAELLEYGGYRGYTFRHVEDIREIMVRNGDARKQIAILEMGWTLDEIHPEYSWFRVSERTQAEYLVRAYEYAEENWSPWIGIMITSYFADPQWTQDDEYWWWSIVLPDGTPREAFYALRNMPKK